MDSLIFSQSKSCTNCSTCILNNYEKPDKWHGIKRNNYNTYYDVQYTQYRRLKTDTPRENKDDKYYEKRKRNNMAAKKSREAKRRRDNEMALKLFILEKENALLKFRLRSLTEELEIIKRTLVFYNTNSVIWQSNVLTSLKNK